MRWAARHGLKLLLGNLSDAGGHDRFEPAQRVHLDVYYSEFAGGRHPDRGRGAGHRAHNDRDRAAARALPGLRRSARCENGAARDLGARRVVFQRDLVGSAEEIIDRLRDDPSIDGRHRTARRAAVRVR